MRLQILYSTWLGLAAIAVARNIPMPKLARQADDCDISKHLPAEFSILDFKGQSTDSGETLTSFNFGYLEKTNNVTTQCHFNSSSENTGPPDRTPRFACENKSTKFIYQDKRITLIQAICPDANGDALVEASGAAVVELECDDAELSTNSPEGSELCKSKEAEFSGKFFSLSPVPPNPNAGVA